MEHSDASGLLFSADGSIVLPPLVRDAGREIDLKEKRQLISQGEDILYVYILLEGEMRVFNAFGNGRVYTIASLSPGTFIGSYELIGGRSQYCSTIETLSPCRVFRIKAETFRNWYGEDDRLCRELAGQLAVSVCENSERSGEILVYPGQYILGEYLIGCYNSVDGEPFLLRKGRQQIADAVGLSVRTVNRSIQALRNDDALVIVKGKISLRDEHIRKIRSINKNIRKTL
jgi:CRP/FNR family cyclic AMP-dependent transcriptional regulator